MVNINDVLIEIFNMPTEKWPIKFREWLFELAHEEFNNTHGWNVASTDEQVREYLSLSLNHYIENLND